MRVLLPASEVFPFIKMGGLGDVIGSLPIALEKLDVNVDVVVPYYTSVDMQNHKVYKLFDFQVPYNGETNTVSVHRTKLPNSGVDVFLLQNPKYFYLGGKHAFINRPTETEMFVFFNRAVVEFVKTRFNTYDLIHCNDWHTGLITHLLEDEVGETRPATLFTIHNLMYQGVGDTEIVKKAGIVPGVHSLIDWDTFDGDINMLQQGISSSDFINTVSPSYAREVMTKEFGGSMSGILMARKDRFCGILNGINYLDYPRSFNEFNLVEKKRESKEDLCRKLRLDNSDRPIFCYVGRLDPHQKGMPILYKVIKNILEDGGNFVLVGKGDPEWEKAFRALNVKGRISCNIVFDTQLANLMYKGSDFILVPSKYEPCGLIQIIAMWYATIPVVRNTGGLRDTVEDGKTGLKFENYTYEDLLGAVKRAFSIYRGGEYVEIAREAMKQNFGWEKSALEYKMLYEKAIKSRTAQ